MCSGVVVFPCCVELCQPHLTRWKAGTWTCFCLVLHPGGALHHVNRFFFIYLHAGLDKEENVLRKYIFSSKTY